MVRRIRTFGQAGRFGKRVLVYLVVDDHRYWVMAPFGTPLDAVLERSTLINRCTIDRATGLPDRGPNWLRNPPPLDPQTALPGLERR
jgi:hypothetical protein